MATTRVVTVPERGVLRVVWSGLANGEIGDRVTLPSHSDASVQVYGTFGVGGSLRLLGTNEAVGAFSMPAQLHDASGNNLIFTAAGLSQILEITNQYAPQITAGDGTTSLTVIIEARRK